MGWRTVFVSSAEKMSFSLNSIVLKRNEDELKIPIEDIDTLVVDNPRTVITPAVLNQLCDNHVNVLLCDEKHNPNVTFLPVSGYFRQFKKVEEQLSWSDGQKDSLWKNIVTAKISNQQAVCAQVGQEAVCKTLCRLASEVQTGDMTGREALAARFYFPAVFGEGFMRGHDDLVNAALNYGYAIILSCFNRSLAAKGLLPYWGIHHKGEYNAFNLSCDLMEPFRPFVDSWVVKHADSFHENDLAFKGGLVSLLNAPVLLGGRREKMHNAIDLFCNYCIDFMAGSIEVMGANHFPAFPDGWWENAI